MHKQKIIFVCTHNSARSQMAEGLMRDLFGDRFDVYSCGAEATFVKPSAIKAMAQAGIDISNHKSETFEPYLDMDIDYVVTVCDNAKEACPYFPNGKNRIHHTFADPSNIGETEEENVAAFAEVRDEIKSWLIENFS